MRILVVDDKFDSRWGIADWLVAFVESVAVESAASAAEALQLIERRKPDVVLATHAVDEGEALELAQRIKARPAAPVVVVLTERAMPSSRRPARRRGSTSASRSATLQSRLLDFLKQRFSVRLAQTRLRR
jgi:CheY-like chemotaxis protein